MISVVALLLSMTSAYVTLFRSVVDLSVVVTRDEFWPGAAKGGLKSYTQMGTFTFINSGNRPVAIQSLGYVLYEIDPRDRDKRDCKRVHGRSGGAAIADPPAQPFEPVVVKNGEILVIKTEFTAAERKGGPMILLQGDNPALRLTARLGPKDKKDIEAIGCIQVSVAAPGIGVRDVEMPIMWSRTGITGTDSDDGESRRGPFGKAQISLIREGI